MFVGMGTTFGKAVQLHKAATLSRVVVVVVFVCVVREGVMNGLTG